MLGGELLTVIYIRPGGTKGYLRVGIESDGKKYDFTVSEAEYREAGSPLTRDNLTREAFGALQYADMRYKAMVKALRILSYGDNSEGMLRRKLCVSGIKREIAEEAVRECVRLGYINSDRQLEKLIINEVNIRNHGPRKIIPRLIAKGYLRSDIERVLSRLTRDGSIDFDEARERLISKLPDGSDSEEIKKTLYKNGHTVY